MSKPSRCDVPGCSVPGETSLTIWWPNGPRALNLCVAHAAEARRFPGRLDLWLAARATQEDTPLDADAAAIKYYVRAHEGDGRRPPPVGTVERALWALVLGAAQRRTLIRTLGTTFLYVIAAAMLIGGLVVTPRSSRRTLRRVVPAWLARRITVGLYEAPLPVGMRCRLLLWWLKWQLGHIDPAALPTYSPRYRAYVSQAAAVVVGMPLAAGKGKADIIPRAYTMQRLTLGYAYVTGCWPLARAEQGPAELPPPEAAAMTPQHAYSEAVMAIYAPHSGITRPEKPKRDVQMVDMLHGRERQGYAAVMGVAPDESTRLPLAQHEDAARYPLNTLAITDLALAGNM